jgi:hypothetical protein
MTKIVQVRPNSRSSPSSEYRHLIKRQQRIAEVIDLLTKEKFKNGVRILKLVLDHEEVKKLDQ